MADVTGSRALDGAPTQNIEVEWQFDAPDLEAVERWLKRGAKTAVTALETRELQDSYFDTGDWRFLRAGRSLRIRERVDRAEATIKSLSETTEGPKQRLEINQTLDAPKLASLLAADGEVSEITRALAGNQTLIERGTVRTRRSDYQVSVGRPRRPAAMLSVDRTRFGADASVSMARVEVELLPGADIELVQPFIERLTEACELTPAQGSKFDHALLASGEPPPLDGDRPAKATPGATLGEVASKGVAAQLVAMRDAEPVARLGEDPEGVHDLRVATRRLRAGLALFRGTFDSDLDALRDELRWLASSMGAVRDLDVMLLELESWQASGESSLSESLDVLKDILEHDRREARREMLTALDEPRLVSLRTDLESLAQAQRLADQAEIDARVAAAGLLHDAHRKFKRDAAEVTIDGPATAWHELRIRGKRLRYAIEFFAPVLGRPAEKALSTLKRVQDVLGELQDSHVAGERLEEIVERESVPARTAFAVGEWAGTRNERALGLRDGFADLLDEFEGDWKQLRRVLQKHLDDRPRKR